MKAPSTWLDQALRRVSGARVAVFGDLALDAYWTLDPDHREDSLETGLPVQRVAVQRYGPGGAANVAANVRVLGVGSVRAVGFVGDDPFGRELRRQLLALGIAVDEVVKGPAAWQTTVFAKPHLREAEQSRLDFGTLNQLPGRVLDRLAGLVELAALASDAVVLNQQAPGGVCTDAMVEHLNRIIARHPERPFVVDSRDRPEQFRGAVVTINAREAARWCGAPETAAVEALAAEIHGRTGRAVFVSRGPDGMVVADGDAVHVVPGIPLPEPTDSVGAGDTVTAALAAALGAGCDALTAARLANLAAAVTVGKLRTTGTASPDEIRALARRTGEDRDG